MDDNRDLVSALTMALGVVGYNACSAYDGLEALEVATSLRPRAIVIDLLLPVMDGWDLAERFRAHAGVFGKPRLIALTGLHGSAPHARSLAAGFDDHLVKPASITELAASIEGRRAVTTAGARALAT